MGQKTNIALECRAPVTTRSRSAGQRGLLTFLLGMTALGLTARASAAAYTILDLGTLGGTYIASNGFGTINASGQVVGYSYVSPPQIHAFRTAPNGPITAASDLGVLASGTESTAVGINDSGQAVGGSSTTADPDGPSHAFRTTSNGVITAASDLGTLGGTFSLARAVNASGQAVGNSLNAGGIPRAFRTAANGPITLASDLGGLGGTRSFAYGVNDLGQAVGSSFIAGNAAQHAFRTAANGPINAASDIGTLGGKFGRAHGINASGTTIGTSTLPGEALQHAFRTAANGPITAGSDLGTLGGTFSAAFGLNSSGQAVGASFTTGDLANHAFLSDLVGSMKDLNDLIPSGSGWELQEAHGINDGGQIAGFGLVGSETHAFLLTPIPEPGSLAPLGIGCFGLLSRKVRSRRCSS